MTRAQVAECFMNEEPRVRPAVAQQANFRLARGNAAASIAATSAGDCMGFANIFGSMPQQLHHASPRSDLAALDIAHTEHRIADRRIVFACL
jgi:hypothetical protein